MIQSLNAKLKYFSSFSSFSKYTKTYRKYADFSMIGHVSYVKNLIVAEKVKDIPGAIVECGVWKGGMIAGISELLGNDRDSFLFDSFEGLPKVTSQDGERAHLWQQQETDQPYFDNCTADIEYARKAMKLSKVKKVHIVKGWFSDTLPHFDANIPIALLRMDGDWYDSTMQILDNLFDKVVEGGVIIIDDYAAWEGCSKAVHDFLSKRSRSEKIHQFENEIYYIKKLGK